MKKTDQKGFGASELIIVILLLVVVAGAGYVVMSKSGDTKESTSQAKTEEASKSDQDSSDSSEDSELSSVLASLGDKVKELASASNYKLEVLNGSTSQIKISASSTKAVPAGNSTYYRTDVSASGPEAYDQYVSQLSIDAVYLKGYAENLGLEEVYSYETTNQADYVFENNVFKAASGEYVELSSSDGGFVISWTD